MTIEQIKASLTLSQVLHYYHLKPDKYNRLNCPFHPDKTPSLQVYYKTHTAYCFSTNCPTHGKSLDVIDFIMHMEKSTKYEAIQKATTMINGGQSKGQQSISEMTRVAVLTKMFTYFKNAIHNSKPAQGYLQQRVLNNNKTEVGYNSGQFHHGTRKDEALIKSCLKYGLLLDLGTKGRTGHPSYKPFGKWGLVFPLRNQQNQIVSLYFRSTLDDKKQRHFYLKDRQGLYPKYPGKETKRLILTESIIDAATLLQQEEITKQHEVLALYGTNGLTEEHTKAIAALKELEEIIFFLNGDHAGIKAVEKYAPMFKSEYPDTKITQVQVPDGEDVNSLLQGHSPEILTHLIETRKEYTFLFCGEPPQAVTSSSSENGVEKEKVTETEEPKITVSGDSPPGLDTNNPHNLKYQGNVALYQIKGFKTDQLDSLKTSLQVIHPHTKQDLRGKLDLYEYKQVKSIAHAAAEKLNLRNDLIEQDLSHLTGLLEHYKDQQLHQKKEQTGSKVQVQAATATKCIEFLKSPRLIKKLNQLITKAGIMGEETNRILLFIIASSYKMPDTLHALIQGSSGSGKTRLLKVISHLMPDEDVKRYTRVTDNSFYNQDEYFFVHKLLCFEDMDGLKEDAQLAVRELQSNEILITSTSIKDANGSIRGGERIVRGPIASLSCTTRGETYEDNISRCFVVAVDETKAQTLRIIHYQNERSAGLIDQEEQNQVTVFIQNCIRLLKPSEVVNPYANKIKLPEEAHKIRRLNELYQSFVKQVTLLNQYQRKQDKQGRLITEKEDLQTACDILFETILLKVDELEGPLRSFFEKLKSFVDQKGKDYEFNRFEVREATGVSKTQQHYYMGKLVGLEYLKQFGHANRGFRYKINHWDNIAATRARIKETLEKQLQDL